MAEISRRNALCLFAAVAVPSAGAVASAAQNDPIIDAIQAYRDGLADFNANAPQDDRGANAYAEVSYLPPMREVERWSQPAVTKRGAIEAIRLANAELQEFDAPETAVAMVRAALAYFENERGVS